ncbi:P-loop NTPase family protein [Streptomyces phaeofaciens]|uniref:ATP-binding protein n=1 Tax=Streptomyces phaeofaciens TaxID=68254 RepID=UPI0016766892|nr:ATP-binding protein [Streptomyces phaeofaciens]
MSVPPPSPASSAARAASPDPTPSMAPARVPAQASPSAAPPDPAPEQHLRPCLTELRLSAFAGHRRAAFPLGTVTLFAGRSGSGKTTALRAYEALARLGGGAPLGEVFPDPVACVPERARPDAQRRRGFRIGCTADGPEGPVRLDVAVQAEPELRVVGERLSAGGVVLLETALRDPGRRTVQAAWHTAGSAPVTRAPLPDDRLGTALLPLRVAGKTDGQRRVLAAAEQMVVALRSVFACDPQPDWMGAPVPTGTGRLLGGCDNLADVLWRTREECVRRHAQLVGALAAGCSRPVTDLLAVPLGDGTVRALLDRGDGTRTELARLGYGELRYVALALVLLTGPGVLDLDTAGEVPSAMQTLTLLADNLDRGLDVRQHAELLRLAVRMAERGHIRCTGAVGDASWAARTRGVTVVHLDP